MSSIADPASDGNKSPKELRCDFCGSRDVCWLYTIRDYVVTPVQAYSIICGGHWGSCDPCRRLISARDKTGLIRRIALCQNIDLTARPATAAFLSSHVDQFVLSASAPIRWCAAECARAHSRPAAQQD